MLVILESGASPLSEIAIFLRRSLAQLGEHLPYKQEVTGSIPVAPTILVFSECGALAAEEKTVFSRREKKLPSSRGKIMVVRISASSQTQGKRKP
jgi:hypothetical protein